MSLESIIEIVKQHPKLIIVDDYEITVKSLRTRSGRWLDEVPTEESHDERIQIALRLLHRRKPGLSTTTGTTPEALSQLVESAFQTAEASREDPWTRFPLWRRLDIPSTEANAWSLQKSEALEHPPGYLEENAIERMGETIIVRKTEKIIRRARTRWQKVTFQLPIRISNSMVVLKEELSGRELTDVLERKKKMYALGDALISGVELRTGISGSCVISARAMATMLRPISKWFCADLFQAGSSPLIPLRRQAGWQSLFAPCIHMTDDANLPWGEMREPFDAEGSLNEKTTVVSHGVPVSLLYDSYHSGKDNRLTTGNLWVPEGEIFPRVAPSAFFIEPGSRPLDALLQEMKDGVLVEQLTGFEMTSPTRWEATPVGFGVKGGKIAKPFKSERISMDVVELLRQATEVAADTAFQGGFGSPSIFFKNLP